MAIMLDYMDARKILEKYGIKSTESDYVESADEAVKFARGKSIVLKLLSDKALHKTKAGLVKLNLSGSTIESAFEELDSKGRELRPYKILAQHMVEPGTETIVGGNTDPQFGKMILFGMGGIYVEALKDVSLRLCPITKYDALQMIDDLKTRDIITRNGLAKDMIVSLLMKVSKMLVEEQRIVELDLNPVVVRDNSYDAIDVRMMV